jgi:CMP/dCMP kinase
MNTETIVANSGTAHLIERRLLLSNVLRKAVSESPVAGQDNRYRFLTISRDRGSLGNTIAEELAGNLGWHLFDKEIVNFISENSHVRENLVRQLDERYQSLIQDTIGRFLGMAGGTPFGALEYHESLIRTLAYLAARGDAIIMGRGGNLALRDDPHGLHVRITASRETRITRLSTRWGVSEVEARRRMVGIETERREFLRRHFQQSADDDRFYDIVFNTDHMQPDHVVASILAIISLPARTSAAPLSVPPPG